MSRGYVYTLELQDDKYYVGFTRDIAKRMSEHMTGNGARFTAKYQPVRIVDVIKGDKNVELAQTIIMMHRFGWQNVRGSDFCEVDMKCKPDVLQVYPKNTRLQFKEVAAPKYDGNRV